MTRLVDKVIKPRATDLGGGFKVRRVLPFHAHKMVGPFIFFDHFGPVDYSAGEGFDVRPHPHIGLATVTFLYEGAIHHKDTVGSDIVIRPGAVNWMTAGRGIVHSERTPEPERIAGQSMHGIQTWVALPEDKQDIAPDFVHHPADTLPEFDLGGAHARVLAGKAFGHQSPVDYPHPIWYVGADAPNGASFTIGKDETIERALYVAEGKAIIDGEEIEPGQMAVLTEGVDVPVHIEPDTRFMLAGGAPMDGPRKIEWNLVSTTNERIEKAKTDWQSSIDGNWTDTVFTLPEGETEHFPLPTE